MKIKRIELKDFGKFKEWGFDIPEKRLLVVVGANGSGKSTAFVESLIWGLYGANWKGVSSDVVIRDGAERCMVTVVAEGVVIEREKWRGRGAVVKVNGRVVKDLSGVVKISKDVFLNSVVFGAGLSGFLNLTDGERREVVAEYVGGEVDELIERLKEYVKNLEREEKILQEEIEVKERHVQGLLQSVDKVEVDEGVLEGLRERRKRLEIFLLLIEEEIERVRDEIEEIEFEKVMLERRYRELLRSKEGKVKELSEVQARMSEIRKKIENLRGIKVCPVCFQEVNEEHRKGILEKLRKEEEELRKLEEMRLNEIKLVETGLDEVEGYEYNVRNKEQDLRKKLGRLVEERSEVEKEVICILEQEKKVREIFELREKLLEEVKRISEEVEGLRKSLEEVKDKKFIAGWWFNKFIQYKSQVFSKVIQSFSQVVNDFLFQLTERFSVKLDYSVSGVKRVLERLGLRVYDRGREVEWKRLSNGERRLVSLALNLCLNYVTSKVLASSWNIVVFDEVFDGLDSKVRERVFRFLSKLVDKMGKSIVVITHDEFEGLVQDEKVQVIRF